MKLFLGAIDKLDRQEKASDLVLNANAARGSSDAIEDILFELNRNF